MSLEPTVSLAGIRVRPGSGVVWVLRLDALRALAQAAGAWWSPDLAPRAEPTWLEPLGAALGLPWGLGSTQALPAWLPWALLAHGVLVLLTLPGCLRVAPRAMMWRRRLGLLAVAEVLFLKVGGVPRAAMVTLWTGLVWVALLRAGLVLSREVARISGEEGLELDPSRPRL